MRVFIDTEFTDLVDMDLISIGLVADNGSEFYGERSDFDLAKCNEFVRSEVLPILNRDPAAVFTGAGLSAAVGSWLDQLASKNPVICYDFFGDFVLLQELLGGAMPAWLKSANVLANIDQAERGRFFQSSALPSHHALNDARANRQAFRSQNVD